MLDYIVSPRTQLDSNTHGACTTTQLCQICRRPADILILPEIHTDVYTFPNFRRVGTGNLMRLRGSVFSASVSGALWHWRKAEGFFFLKGLAKRFVLKGLAEPSVDFELQQAIGEGLFAGSSFAASYWGRTIRRVFFCSKLLGKDYPQGLLLQQAIGEGLSAGSSFAASYWGRTIRRVFFCSKLLGKVHS